jgi:CheY-like chemotaxis protein
VEKIEKLARSFAKHRGYTIQVGCAYEGLKLAIESHNVRKLASSPLAAQPVAEEALRGARILVVDDDPDIRVLVNKALSQDGHTVIEAASGQEALDLIDKQIPDLLVLDLLMPKQGGLEVLKVLRSRPATAALPVLVLTALNDESNTRAGFDLGATDYVTKPFTIPQLAARVRACLLRCR